ncbi:alanyl-tRNA synthetase [Bradyrhizobium sp. LM2.7]
MSGVNEIRSTFLNFFAENGHEIVSSSPLVPRNDPTLMFTNAGMVQFKNVFTGMEKRPYQRATTSQKCVRAGGKHNDLDNVGYTARHLTFFEMLGNFSFGDYFKERAIELAWKLITKEFGLKKDKLLVTVYHTDDEAAGLWKKIAGFSDDRIIRIPTSDNFWAMGDTGPCGPCSEIFIDRGEHIWGGPPGSPEEDGDRFLEFWNLVFMQYEQVTKEERVPLPRPSIDTGMGLERMACIMQGVDSVFETDLFRHLIDATASALGSGPNEQTVASFRVIADHLRSSAFLVSDGVLPSNEGRGYVLRRIMRRAMRHAQLLGAKDPLMHRLVWALVREMGQAYPELVRAENLIEETLRLEETRFRKTLVRGLAILDEKSASLKKGDMFDGDVAFTLYDTYGFPLDLTQDALKSRGISVDQSAFTDAMDRQKAKARESWKGSGEAASEAIWFPLREKLGATEFLGYETESAEGVVSALVKDGREAGSLKAGETGALLLNQTPFYAESGGQVGDTGVLLGEGGIKFRVTDTQKKVGDLFVHVGTVESGEVKLGTALQLEVDHGRRSSIRAHHSATHLIHEALRQVLGDHIAQRGSLVAPDRLRFDFVHPKPITAEELARVEDIANNVVLENDEVTTRVMGVDEAREAGARALFGEKYGDEVRVVSMGRTARERGTNALGWSVELCGGTHVRRTGDIGPDHADRRERGRLRRSAYRGADRQLRTPACQPHHGAGEDRGQRAAHLDRRRADTHCRADGGAQEARARAVRCPQEARDGRRRIERQRRGHRRARDRRRQADGACGRGHRDEGSQGPRRRRQEADRLRRGRYRRRHRGRQGRNRGRRHRGPHRALQRRKPGARRLRSARRQGRRRPAGHGAGRRPRRRQCRSGAVSNRKSDGRRVRPCASFRKDVAQPIPT